jgi:hypothetical protein
VKGFIVFVVIVALAFFGYNYWMNKKAADVPISPYLCVEEFYNTTAKMSKLIWNEEENAKFKQEIKNWSQAEEGSGFPKSLKEYDITDPSILFLNADYGKHIFGTLCLYEIESYDIEQAQVDNGKASVKTVFISSDFMGLGKAMSSLSPAQQKKKAENILTFRLVEKRGHWYIDELEGKAADLAEHTYRLRKMQGK